MQPQCVGHSSCGSLLIKWGKWNLKTNNELLSGFNSKYWVTNVLSLHPEQDILGTTFTAFHTLHNFNGSNKLKCLITLGCEGLLMTNTSILGPFVRCKTEV